MSVRLQYPNESDTDYHKYLVSVIEWTAIKDKVLHGISLHEADIDDPRCPCGSPATYFYTGPFPDEAEEFTPGIVMVCEEHRNCVSVALGTISLDELKVYRTIIE